MSKNVYDKEGGRHEKGDEKRSSRGRVGDQRRVYFEKSLRDPWTIPLGERERGRLGRDPLKEVL